MVLCVCVGGGVLCVGRGIDGVMFSPGFVI